MADNNFGKSRKVDMVICIDGTGSMTPCIETVKAKAIMFKDEFANAMTALGSSVDSMRVKIIVFRDYKSDGQQAMEQSPFFELPGDNPEFEKYLADIQANGGGDNPENGLEALYYAMKSDFTTGEKDRQVIVLFTDDDALDLKERAAEPGYPADMVDMTELITAWTCCSQDPSFKLKDKLKRLVIFAPEGTKYQKLATQLNRSVFRPVDRADGMKSLTFETIMNIIAASASAS